MIAVPTSASSKVVSLRDVIDSPRRLDELGIARVIASAAEVVHKLQKGGQPVGTLTPDAIAIGDDGEIAVQAGAAKAGYVAPERLRGEAGDRRSDVFSLGAILWEALAHEPLFGGEIEGEIKAAVLEGEYRAAQELNANVPPELEAICKKALARTPGDRYPSCKVMAAELATVLDDADYPEDNTAIAEYLRNQYVQPEPKPVVVPSSRPTPLPTEKSGPRAATTTLQGVSPRAEIEAAKAKIAAADNAATDPKQTLVASGELKKPAEPRSKTPSGSALPSWAMAQPADAPAPAAKPEPSPASTLPGVPAMLDKPPAEGKPSFSKTAVLGSMSSADLAPQVLPPVLPATSSPSIPIGKKTEVHGSASIADRLAAINNGTATPPPAVAGLPAVPPGADPIKPPAVNITTAETVPTPALAAYAQHEAKAAAALEAISQPSALDATAPAPVVSSTPTPPPSEAVAMPAAATGTAVSTEDASVHPASVVALPRTSARARTDATGTRDPLAGWGWGTGPHEAIGHDDDDYYETQRSQRKRLVYAIGGAAAAVLLVVVAAFAFRDGDKEKKPTDVAAKQAEPAVDWSQPTDPPPAPAVEPAPAAGSGSDIAAAGSAVDPAAGSAAGSAAIDPAEGSAAGSAEEAPAVAVEPPKEEPAPEPPKEEPKKIEPPKEEPKPEPQKEPKKEPKKAEPKVAKAEPKKPKTSSWDPLSRTVDRRKEPKPVDPYAERKPAVDASAAYKTGIQQFARGDAAGALSTFKASLRDNPKFAPTWRGIGMVYERLGKKSQAKTAFRRYLELSPRAGDAAQIRERMRRL